MVPVQPQGRHVLCEVELSVKDFGGVELVILVLLWVPMHDVENMVLGGAGGNLVDEARIILVIKDVSTLGMLPRQE